MPLSPLRSNCLGLYDPVAIESLLSCFGRRAPPSHSRSERSLSLISEEVTACVILLLNVARHIVIIAIQRIYAGRKRTFFMATEDSEAGVRVLKWRHSTREAGDSIKPSASALGRASRLNRPA